MMNLISIANSAPNSSQLTTVQLISLSNAVLLLASIPYVAQGRLKLGAAARLNLKATVSRGEVKR